MPKFPCTYNEFFSSIKYLFFHQAYANYTSLVSWTNGNDWSPLSNIHICPNIVFFTLPFSQKVANTLDFRKNLLKYITISSDFWSLANLTCCYFILFFTLFYFTILYWFCHTLTWIHHRCTCIPKHEPPSHLPPHNISLGHPRVPAPSILYPASDIDWRFDSYMILYMFQCHSPKSKK